MNEIKFQNAVVRKGYNPAVSKSWEAKHFNDVHSHDIDFFLYIQQGELVIGLEHEEGLIAKVLLPGDSLEVLAGITHYESVGDEGVSFLVAQKV
jgi:cupin superfamily acireductone dioxygenase involved in methionine salvage